MKKKRSVSCPNEGFKRQLSLYQEMNYFLNINYRPYRLHQLSILENKVRLNLMDITSLNSINSLKSLINDYLTKFHDSNKLGSAKVIFKCKKCRLFLFSEINVLTNSSMNNQTFNYNSRDVYNNVINTNCQNIFIEPMSWMIDEICCLSGILNCNNCFSRIGKFHWQGIDCSVDCVKHAKIKPAFKIDAKKIDHHIL